MNKAKSVDQIFIEKDQKLQITQLKRVLQSENTECIKNHFFNSKIQNISGVTDILIKKHSQVLTHRNKIILKQLLTQKKQKGETPFNFKTFKNNQQKTIYGNDQKDYDEGIQFSLLQE